MTGDAAFSVQCSEPLRDLIELEANHLGETPAEFATTAVWMRIRMIGQDHAIQAPVTATVPPALAHRAKLRWRAVNAERGDGEAPLAFEDVMFDYVTFDVTWQTPDGVLDVDG